MTDCPDISTSAALNSEHSWYEIWKAFSCESQLLSSFAVFNPGALALCLHYVLQEIKRSESEQIGPIGRIKRGHLNINRKILMAINHVTWVV